MSIDPINIGGVPNDGNGQDLRSGGQIINDNFAELDTRTTAAQAKAEQGVANAAAARDAAAEAKAIADAAVPATALGDSVPQLINGVVPASQLPSFVDDVLEFPTLEDFPEAGETGKIYIAVNDGDSPTNPTRQYRWSGSAFVLIPSSPGSTDQVPEGPTNQYFTQSRVRSTTLSGLGTLVNAAILATDTVLQAFAKLQGQLNAKLGKSEVAADASKLGGQPASYYTATMAGATASADGVKGLVPAPAIVDKDRYLKGDGSYGDVGGLPVGSLVPWHVSEASLPSGHIPANGQLIDRAVFPQLWTLVSTVAVTDAQWLADGLLQTRFSAGNGSTTFRMPDLNGKHAGGTMSAMFLRGYGRGSSEYPGNAQLDQLQGHAFGGTDGWSLAEFGTYPSAASTVANLRAAYHTLRNNPYPASTISKMQTDGANGVPRVGLETRPTNVAVIWCFIGGATAANPGTVDVTALAALVASQASQIQNLQVATPKKWVSDWRKFSANVGSIFQHNMGAPVTSFRWDARITTATAGYPVGTELVINTITTDNGGGGLTIYNSDSTSFTVRTHASANGTVITNLTNGVATWLPWSAFDIRCTVTAL
ncbi:putative tail fibre protein [Pseudomonas sp. Os17]|uniref:phage tail protein n=1 Tax=Pseudomonas sp. Os17 TaxID=1500686 RepID=UPI0005FC81A1|nr:phage tail protein [Pseudomonas sp. Os17]BAQ75134.1 putative tail fibre protein [Pseudomonas sp. Os17]